MPDFSTSVMVALIPTTNDWCRIKLPHLTLVYAGEMKDLKASNYNDLAKDASLISMNSKPITLKVKEVGIFGSTDKVDVLRLESTPELAKMRKTVAHWNASEFPFNPHVTIGPTGPVNKKIPGSVTFNQILVGWGEEMLTFWLKGGS